MFENILGLCTGVALGTLVGLSVTPVVGGVITALLAAGLATTKAFGEKMAAHSFRIISLITIGTAVGAVIGLYIRVNDVLVSNEQQTQSHQLLCGGKVIGGSMKNELEFWRATGKKDEEMALQLFQAYLKSCAPTPPNSSSDTKLEKLNEGLFSFDKSQCSSLLNSNSDTIVGLLKSSEFPLFKLLGYSPMTANEMRVTVEYICKSENQ